MGQSVNPISFRLNRKFFSIKKNFSSADLIRTQLNFKSFFIRKLLSKKSFRRLKLFFDGFKFYYNTKTEVLQCCLFVHCFSIRSFKISKRLHSLLTCYISAFIISFAKTFFFSRRKKINFKVKITSIPSAESVIGLFSFFVKKRVKARKAFLKVKKILNKYNFQGFKVRIGGRYTRQQRAAHEIYLVGTVPLATLDSYNLSYATRFVRLRNGSCGIKTWLCQKK